VSLIQYVGYSSHRLHYYNHVYIGCLMKRLLYFSWLVIIHWFSMSEKCYVNINMFNISWDITYIMKRLTVPNGTLHWLRTSELVSTQQVFTAISFRGFSTWQHHRSRCTSSVTLVSVISSDTPTTSCIPTSSKQGVSSVAKRVAK
jgi:hypothetical protein